MLYDSQQQTYHKHKRRYNMLTVIIQFFTVFTCAIFCGAALYITFVEHPARLSCGTEIALLQWAPSYQRATIMQATLAISGFIFSLVTWLITANNFWLFGGVLLGLVVPYTLISIMPINKRLLCRDLDKKSEKARYLLKKWGYMHIVRSLLSTTALVIFLLA